MKINYLQKIFILYITLMTPSVLGAQDFAFGIKGGGTAGSQRWNEGGSYDNSLLFKYHGAVFIESVTSDNASVLFAQAGYHTRGSAFRFRKGVAFTTGGSQIDVPAYKQEFIFHNAALLLGAKRRGVLNNENAFYTLGLRGEYTFNTNLGELDQNSIYSFSYPNKQFVRKLNFGLSLSGGYEFQFSELTGAFLELSVHPDLTRQYFQQPINVNYRDPFTQQIVTSIPQNSIRNITIELSLGFRFLRKIIYTD